MKKKTLNNVFEGLNNLNIEQSRQRLMRGNTYRDVSTICIVPIRAPIEPEIVFCWMNMMTAMNQKFYRLPVKNMEVADAYNEAIKLILDNPELSKWKYVLTLETDNMPPPDGLLKLYESIDKVDCFGLGKTDVVGGLYWTKGENGQPMIYGDPRVFPKNFIPQVPIPDALQPSNGLGMGFTLFKLDMFKKIEPPWFRTVQEYTHGQGAKMGTQDLIFFEKASKHGYRFACDTRCKVGHFDASSGTIW